MQIRSLTINEYDQLVQLWETSGLRFRLKGRDSIADEINSRLLPRSISGWINRLAIDPKYRKRGIAKALIAESERFLRKHGIHVFSALIEDSNQGYEELKNIIYYSKRDDEEI